MNDRQMFELLEDRKMLASSGTLKLAPNVVYFNAVEADNTATPNSQSSNSSGGPHESSYQLRVYNTSTTSRLLIQPFAVKIEGADAADFSIDTTTYNNATGISMAPGKQINITIDFNADDTVGLKTADIRFVTSDPKHPIVKWPLRGLVTKGEGTTYEPSLQQVFDFFQLGINAGEVANSSNPYFVPSGTSDEVDVQTLVKAGDGDVTITPLAEFTNHADPDVRMGFYTPGQLGTEQYIWYSPSASSQSVAPLAYGQTKFDPGTAAFGLVTQYPDFYNPDNTIRNVYSETALNKSWDNTSLVHMKFYPYIDSNGNTVANAYIVAEEEYSVDSVSDSQDLVFVVTNVKPADDTPTISVKNTLGYPSNDILPFNTIQNQDTNVGNIFRNTNSLTISNSGEDDLTYSASISGPDAADYSITSNGSGTITAGSAAKALGISFNATSGARVHTATLTITSNDLNHPTETITLNGYWQQYSEQAGPGQPSLEPNAQTIINGIFGYGTVLAGSSAIKNHGLYEPVGDEIKASYFTAADTGAQVTVTDLANFHSEAYLDSNNMYQPTTSYTDYYIQGSPGSPTEILADKAKEGQMILPLSSGAHGSSSSNVAAGHFNPGSQVFGFAVEPNMTKGTGEYSDPTLNANPNNTPGFGYFLRFFPAKDASGKVIPNTYIMLHDYDTSTVNYDFNDEIYLITNVIPVGQMKTVKTVYAESTAEGNEISFTSPDDGPKVYGFNIYRSLTADGTYTLIGSTGRKSAATYVDATATPGTTYYYAIATVGNGGVESQRVVTDVVG